MYETRHDRPASRRRFTRRLATHLALVLGLLLASLAMGMLGYVALERLSWTDAFLNAAMLLGGMGPVDPPRTTAGKLFAGCYALYAGLLFIVSATLIAAPVLHRILHHFHWNEKV
jgi:hypothetical protein